ncbi:MAG: T9SS type A sorting domain-containing protein [Crocinitomicaceae bacterium]|nr:T9SS type A sorting domain-containing protein [Crocinitomicaceae bacterium]
MTIRRALANAISILSLSIGLFNYSYSQCTNGTSYGGIAAPTAGGSNTQSCNYASEYLPVSTVAAGTNYIASSTIATDFLTVRQGAFNGPVVASGVTPLNWTSTVAGNYYVHINVNAACATASGCRNITVTHIIPTTPMSFVSSTSAQATTADIENCSSYGEIIRVEVVTTGTVTPLGFTQLIIRTDGCTAPLSDLSAIEIYYSGTSATFSTANLFGNAAPASTGVDIVVNGSQTLAEGTNYFWIVYDVSLAATVGNFVDGVCNQITVDGSNEVPINTNPAGNREIVDCARACPTSAIAFSETFDSGTITGADPSVIYGNGGSNHNAALAISGTYFGWFNIQNGVSNVDLYDVYMGGLYNDCEATISYWVRESYGGMAIQITMIDDNGTLIASNNMTLTATYQQFTHTFTPVTPGIQFLIHTTATGGSGIDLVIEDLIMEQCCDIPLLLPVELVNFRGSCVGNETILEWSTASELNNKYFEIEKLDDNGEWKVIGEVDGAGNSSTLINYSFIDRDLISSFYRLKQVDFDGAFKYSDVIYIDEEECVQASGFIVFPNPANDFVMVQVSSSNDQEIKIYDFMGRVVKSSVFNEEIRIETADWAQGMYTIKVGDQVKQFIVN